MRLGFLLAPLRGIARTFRTTRRTAAKLPDVVEAILILPKLAEQLEVVGFHTATLREMHAEITRVKGDTERLPQIDEKLERMAVLLDRIDGNTTAVHDLAEVALPLQGAALRVGRIADRLPQRRVPRAPGP